MKFLIGIVVGIIVSEIGMESIAHSIQSVIDFIKSLVH